MCRDDWFDNGNLPPGVDHFDTISDKRPGTGKHRKLKTDEELEADREFIKEKIAGQKRHTELLNSIANPKKP